eukprot:2598726-Alexandrium_andersonii.AAC.1
MRLQAGDNCVRLRSDLTRSPLRPPISARSPSRRSDLHGVRSCAASRGVLASQLDARVPIAWSPPNGFTATAQYARSAVVLIIPPTSL